MPPLYRQGGDWEALQFLRSLVHGVTSALGLRADRCLPRPALDPKVHRPEVLAEDTHVGHGSVGFPSCSQPPRHPHFTEEEIEARGCEVQRARTADTRCSGSL